MTPHMPRKMLWLVCLVLPLGCAPDGRTDIFSTDSTTATVRLLTAGAAASPTRPATISETLPNQARAAPTTSSIVRGDGQLINAPANATRGANIVGGDAISLNFVNAPVAEVAAAVLGDFLKLNYLVAGNVQGSVTLQTSAPLPRAAVLPALETAFQLGGLALVNSPAGWRVVPINDAARADPALRIAGGQRGPGYGVEIVPLRYIGAEQMQLLLDPIMPHGALLRADPAHNLLLLAGTGAERAAIEENIQIFDIDTLAGMSFAMFTLGAGEARAVARDLAEALGPNLAGMVRIMPIPRLNALLVISPQPRYLDQIKGWVMRLDQPARGEDRRLHIYHVQNSRAKDLASVLARVLGGDADTAATGAQPAASPPGTPSGALPSAATAADPSAKAGALGDLLGDVGTGAIKIVPDVTNNVLLIYATARDYTMITAALASLDVAPTQVLIEATIAEVTLTKSLNFGLQYFFQSGGSQFIQSFGTTSAIAASFPGAAYILNSGATPQIIVNALEAITHVNVVSDPEILVLNNQTAELKVGDQVPVAVQSAVSVITPGAPVVNSIEFRDTGVILRVTPRVNRNGLVMMDVSQEVSDVATTTSSTLNSPTIQQRKITSSIAVQDGETVALGGLIKDSDQRAKSGIPYIKDIPVLGSLVSDIANSDTRTELLVMLTPRVVRDAHTLRGITSEMRDHIAATRPLLANPN